MYDAAMLEDYTMESSSVPVHTVTALDDAEKETLREEIRSLLEAENAVLSHIFMSMAIFKISLRKPVVASRIHLKWRDSVVITRHQLWSWPVFASWVKLRRFLRRKNVF